MVATCHYVDSNWNLHKRTLNLCCIPQPHSGHMILMYCRAFLLGGRLSKRFGQIWWIILLTITSCWLLKDNLSCDHNLPLNGQLFNVIIKLFKYSKYFGAIWVVYYWINYFKGPQNCEVCCSIGGTC